MATQITPLWRSTDSDFGVQVVNSKVNKVSDGRYVAVTTINGRTLEAFGHSEGLAGEALTQLVNELTVRGELAGPIN